MPTEQLKQALRETNVAGVEKDFAEVLANMFDLPVQVVARIAYAIEMVKHPVTWHLGTRAHELIPDAKLRMAIRDQANAGAARVHLRKLQLEGRQVSVPTLAMVSTTEPARICEGCSNSASCIAENLSTPELCTQNLTVGYARGYVPLTQKVTLLRVTSDNRIRVRARQPLGDHDLPIEAVEY